MSAQAPSINTDDRCSRSWRGRHQRRERGGRERAVPWGRKNKWVTCISNDSKAFRIIGDYKEAANNAVRWCEAAKSREEKSMAEWRENEKSMACTRHTKDTLEEIQSVVYSVLASGVTARRQVVALGETFNGPDHALAPDPNPQCQGRNVRTHTRAETQIPELSRGRE